MLLRLDGMKHYATAQIDEKWTAVNSSHCTWSVEAEGRNGGNCIKRLTTSATTGSGYLTQAPLMTRSGVWTPTNSGAMGMAVKVNDLLKVSTNVIGGAHRNFLLLEEGAGPVFGVQLNPNGTFSYYFHSGAPLATEYVGSSVQGLRNDEWAYVEHKWLIHESAGTWETWLNGVKIFDFTGRTNGGQDASHDYTDIWNGATIFAMQGSVGLEVRFCDFYLIDLESSVADDWDDVSGDITVGYITGEGVGDSTEFTPSAGDNFENIDELSPDDDTTTNTSTTPGDRDNFVMQDVPVGVEIVGFQTVVYAKKDGDGSSLLQPTLRIDSTDYDATAQGVASTDQYVYLLQPYDVSPATDAKLTEAEANAMQAGYVKA